MSLDKDQFVARYGGVYEHSPWIAKQAFDGGLRAAGNSADGLSRTMTAIVEAAGEDAQLALLRAHPDLAGKLAIDGALTAESTSEQAGAGLDHCTQEEFARFQTLNSAYTRKFEFPFILAVAGYKRAEIIDIFENRVGNDRQTELHEALKQVHRIALLRLTVLMQEGDIQ